ncbi:DUF3995 domain-containing protein [Salaquimonas pukyongi]|uniref:DUF3995 domain-containing protein n=1 Tax=Salaquimonas pukyongi TaxID=2712698 RepID=UPI00096B9B45|nr:DUF3995 domain-containing protein [Salaquimonas pukyongi]
MNILVEALTTRDYAVLIWLTIAISVLSIYPAVRSGAVGVLRAALTPKLSAIFLTYALYVGAACWIGYRFGFWSPSDLKATIVWVLFTGTILLGRAIGQPYKTKFFTGIVRDNFRMILIVEFMVVAYTFALWKELLLIPWFALLGMLQAASQNKPEHKNVESLVSWLLVISVVLLIVAFAKITLDTHGAIFNLSTLREVLLPVWLSIVSVPAFYVTYCFARWEQARIRINLKSYHSDEVKGHAQRLFRRLLFFRPDLCFQAVRQFNASDASTEQDVWNIVNEVLENARRRNNPKPVDPADGWSPTEAEKYLSGEGLEASDYHRAMHGSEWYANSNAKYVQRDGLSQTLQYIIEGNQDAVTKLKLKGSFEINPYPDAGINAMIEVGSVLIEKAMDINQIPEDILTHLQTVTSGKAQLGHYLLEVRVDRFDEANVIDIALIIQIAKMPTDSTA